MQGDVPRMVWIASVGTVSWPGDLIPCGLRELRVFLWASPPGSPNDDQATLLSDGSYDRTRPPRYARHRWRPAWAT